MSIKLTTSVCNNVAGCLYNGADAISNAHWIEQWVWDETMCLIMKRIMYICRNNMALQSSDSEIIKISGDFIRTRFKIQNFAYPLAT